MILKSCTQECKLTKQRHGTRRDVDLLSILLSEFCASRLICEQYSAWLRTPESLSAWEYHSGSRRTIETRNELVMLPDWTRGVRKITLAKEVCLPAREVALTTLSRGSIDRRRDSTSCCRSPCPSDTNSWNCQRPIPFWKTFVTPWPIKLRYSCSSWDRWVFVVS